jgi:hypothetical protein
MVSAPPSHATTHSGKDRALMASPTCSSSTGKATAAEGSLRGGSVLWIHEAAHIPLARETSEATPIRSVRMPCFFGMRRAIVRWVRTFRRASGRLDAPALANTSSPNVRFKRTAHDSLAGSGVLVVEGERESENELRWGGPARGAA